MGETYQQFTTPQRNNISLRIDSSNVCLTSQSIYSVSKHDTATNNSVDSDMNHICTNVTIMSSYTSTVVNYTNIDNDNNNDNESEDSKSNYNDLSNNNNSNHNEHMADKKRNPRWGYSPQRGQVYWNQPQ